MVTAFAKPFCHIVPLFPQLPTACCASRRLHEGRSSQSTSTVRYFSSDSTPHSMAALRRGGSSSRQRAPRPRTSFERPYRNRYRQCRRESSLAQPYSSSTPPHSRQISAVTSSAGQYTSTGLLPGRYTVTVSSPGFAKSIKDQVNVRGQHPVHHRLQTQRRRGNHSGGQCAADLA